MQQAYQALRVISEAQTVHIVLAARPGELLLAELCTACEALGAPGSSGIKAVVLDLAAQAGGQGESLATDVAVERARSALRAVPQPVLAVARASLSSAACTLLADADFTLVAHEAELCLPGAPESGDNRIRGAVAARLGYATWNAPAASLDLELERILDMLRAKSALALRHAKASARFAASPNAGQTQLETLRLVNQFYLDNVTVTRDAREGPQAFLEKRPPRWQNR
ncbi:MAG TPA: hypothetical protein VF458_08195 [Ktedonobacteraceae bacterium]